MNDLSEVFLDFREGDGAFSRFLVSDPDWKDDQKKRYRIYADLNDRTDADHWKRAIDSYRSYPCFSDDSNTTLQIWRVVQPTKRSYH